LALSHETDLPIIAFGSGSPEAYHLKGRSRTDWLK